MIFTLCGGIILNLNTLSGSKITIVVLSEGKDLEIVCPFGSIFAEKDTRSKNGENDTLPSGTYPVPKILKCPPGGAPPEQRDLFQRPVPKRWSWG